MFLGVILRKTSGLWQRGHIWLCILYSFVTEEVGTQPVAEEGPSTRKEAFFPNLSNISPGRY